VVLGRVWWFLFLCRCMGCCLWSWFVYGVSSGAFPKVTPETFIIDRGSLSSSPVRVYSQPSHGPPTWHDLHTLLLSSLGQRIRSYSSVFALMGTMLSMSQGFFVHPSWHRVPSLSSIFWLWVKHHLMVMVFFSRRGDGLLLCVPSFVPARRLLWSRPKWFRCLSSRHEPDVRYRE